MNEKTACGNRKSTSQSGSISTPSSNGVETTPFANLNVCEKECRANKSLHILCLCTPPVPRLASRSRFGCFTPISNTNSAISWHFLAGINAQRTSYTKNTANGHLSMGTPLLFDCSTSNASTHCLYPPPRNPGAGGAFLVYPSQVTTSSKCLLDSCTHTHM